MTRPSLPNLSLVHLTFSPPGANTPYLSLNPSAIFVVQPSDLLSVICCSGVGGNVGFWDGDGVGFRLGDIDGLEVLASVGKNDGTGVGFKLGGAEGIAVGLEEGSDVVGPAEGS